MTAPLHFFSSASTCHSIIGSRHSPLATRHPDTNKTTHELHHTSPHLTTRTRSPPRFCSKGGWRENPFSSLSKEATAMFRRKNNIHENEKAIITKVEKINELRTTLGPLSGRSAQFTTDSCLRRYLEARNWNVEKSKKMLEETLNWRATYRPEEIRWNEVAAEGETGKLYRATFRDREGRSVLILSPGKQNTSSHDSQLRHLVYLLENAILNMPDGQEQMVWLIDFTGWSLTATPIKTARETANILQSHYPERLSFAFLYNPPKIFETFWKIVKYFLDTKTFHKVKFIYPKNKESMELLGNNFDLDELPVELGGKRSHHYDHEEFSQLMTLDDLRLASLWGLNSGNGYSSSEVAPEPVLIGSVASSA